MRTTQTQKQKTIVVLQSTTLAQLDKCEAWASDDDNDKWSKRTRRKFASFAENIYYYIIENYKDMTMVDFCGHHRRRHRRCVLIILQICGVKFLCVFSIYSSVCRNHRLRVSIQYWNFAFVRDKKK